MKVLFRSLDLETSGYAPPDGEVVEIGLIDMEFDTETHVYRTGEAMATLYAPTKPLTPENMAVHHITNRMLDGRQVCDEEALRDAVHHLSFLNAQPPTFVVAHNWRFEGQWFTPEILGEIRPICTYKCALRLFPDAPSHSNQALRYMLDLDLDTYEASPPHRAGPDAYVTAHILGEMLQRAMVRDLVGWTMAPRHIPTCPLPKHKGRAWDTVPGDYLHWIIYRATGVDDDVKHAASTEIERRKGLGL